MHVHAFSTLMSAAASLATPNVPLTSQTEYRQLPRLLTVQHCLVLSYLCDRHMAGSSCLQYKAAVLRRNRHEFRLSCPFCTQMAPAPYCGRFENTVRMLSLNSLSVISIVHAPLRVRTAPNLVSCLLMPVDAMVTKLESSQNIADAIHDCVPWRPPS